MRGNDDYNDDCIIIANARYLDFACREVRRDNRAKEARLIRQRDESLWYLVGLLNYSMDEGVEEEISRPSYR